MMFSRKTRTDLESRRSVLLYEKVSDPCTGVPDPDPTEDHISRLPECQSQSTDLPGR